MRFKTTLPSGCTVKAGSIPVRMLSSVECESETPIKVDLVNGVGLIAMADERSIDDINNNPANIYHRPNAGNELRRESDVPICLVGLSSGAGRLVDMKNWRLQWFNHETGGWMTQIQSDVREDFDDSVTALVAESAREGHWMDRTQWRIAEFDMRRANVVNFEPNAPTQPPKAG